MELILDYAFKTAIALILVALITFTFKHFFTIKANDYASEKKGKYTIEDLREYKRTHGIKGGNGK